MSLFKIGNTKDTSTSLMMKKLKKEVMFFGKVKYTNIEIL
jgi:hypothetical protein